MTRERAIISFVALVLSFLLGCSSNTPNSAECITAFDCEDGYTCQDGTCVALPDNSVTGDGDTAGTDTSTDEMLDDTVTDEELPPDEEKADEATDTDEDTPIVTDDPIVTDEDTFLSDDDLFIDTTPPAVMTTTPATDATGVGIATTVEIVFSEPMNEATLTTATLILEQGDTAISGAVTYAEEDLTATFTPDASLAYGTLYTVTVTTGAEDPAGNGLAVDHVFSFTTAAEEVNECVTMANPCNDHGDSGGSCVDTVGAYTCICSSGFGFSGGGCKDIDECAPDGKGPCDDNGDPDATCANTPGSYTCTCVTPGYEFKSASCRDIDECIVNTNPCDNGGDTGATCNNTPGDYTCNCSVGWHDNGTICEETNECEGDPCNDEGDLDSTCQEGVGTYTCTCSDGWNFDDGKTCKETDECVTLNDPCDDQGDNGATCNDGMATYTCTCSLHYSWNFETCVPDTKTLTCSGAPANTLYYNGTSSYSYSQTWGGSDWVPPDSAATYNAAPAANTCQFKCAAHYTWNGTDTCTADTQPFTCTAKPATGTVWNTVSGYTQTWNGTAWAPADDPTTEYNTDPSDTACRYKCAANYEWSGTACINTRTEACSNLPDNAVYYNNTTSYSIPQAYSDGGGWQPFAIAYYDDGVPDINTCEYKCAANYTRHNGACVNSRTQSCDAPPSNTVYYNNTTSYSIPQTYTDGTGWQPPTTPYYNDGVPDNNTCEYKCAANYQWNGSACINSRTQACSGLPGNATYYNGLTAYSIPQTYTDGGGWTPPATAYYDATPDNNTCGFACAATYHWDGVSACVSDTRTYTCTGLPSNSVYYNGTSSYSYAQTWSGSWDPPDSSATYNANPAVNTCQYKCVANYTWSGTACINSRSQACSGIISNAVYYNNTSSYSIPQTYTDATGWQPPTTAYYDDGVLVADTCEYKCAANYTWNGSACINTRANQACTGLPSNSLYYNNTTSYSITQTYTDATGWQPPTTAYYDATPDNNTCGYKCAANYTWSGSACINSRTNQSCTGLPSNSVYYNNTTSYSITQSYTDGSGWQPPTAASYNASPTENTCQYKCAANYTWSGSACINSRTQACSGLPANAVYYGDAASYSIPQTYTDGSGWQPPSTAYYDATPDINTCGFKCKVHYTWNGSNACVADTQPYSCSGAPSNTVYYSGTSSYSYTQTWNGTAWSPADSAAYYDATPDINTCGYKCATNYWWNGSACINTRTQACSGLLTNAVYYGDAASYSIPQTYTDGGGWQPPSTAYYDATPDINTCGFKCKTHYTWNGGSNACVADTQPYSCSGAPANTVYYNNTASYSYTQTWNGTAWSPADSAAYYDATPDINTCGYKCATGYSWNGSACVAAYCGDGISGNSTIPTFTEGFEGSFPPAYAHQASQFTSDASGWERSSTRYHGASYSMKNVAIDDDGFSAIFLQKYTTIVTDVSLCFYYTGQSESGYDFFFVFKSVQDFLDAATTAYNDAPSAVSNYLFRATGDKSSQWYKQCVTVPAGYPTVVFAYMKDYADATGWDAFYVDDVTFHPAVTEQCDGGTTNCTNLGYSVAGTVNCGSDCTWASGESGEKGCNNGEEPPSCSLVLVF